MSFMFRQLRHIFFVLYCMTATTGSFLMSIHVRVIVFEVNIFSLQIWYKPLWPNGQGACLRSRRFTVRVRAVVKFSFCATQPSASVSCDEFELGPESRRTPSRVESNEVVTNLNSSCHCKSFCCIFYVA